MDSTVVIASMVILIVLLLVVGAPIKPMRFLGRGTVKLVIGVLFLFFFNVFGASIGLHLPINVYTAVIVGFLGIPGLASLTALHIFVIG
ncbi:pro-sigmaK processing inhibitor BofA family protein [Aquibacillus kalidii]|uniref:pro-sigmaK processing inhibitor BofA family protein n=1 Tax=Aquibacillus kalidii TaxID=2762597 RepID=UPI0016471CF7|nr:pro-sigmaK processing inhibitor BofA family protein [Aquibacillus kalidii]